MEHLKYLLCSIILFSFFVSSCEKNEEIDNKQNETSNDLCFGYCTGNQFSGYSVTAYNFWEDGRLTTFNFKGASAFTSEITDLSSNITIMVKCTNISYSGGCVSSFSMTLNGGKYNNKKYSYPANRCN